ncbi:MAG: DUF5666 domain-containing protein [Limnobacter sp.]|uniref:DUF5666 domain-containing protein n=1 Tax=Limnobacter sp. TaxID=2003368 RepID=UPI0022BE6E32|nr:DUF5666 domain-containing protein [Limnobacter sp.]MCZ8014400.1 DUF5666 domain-containing protein [Limnobacter sp.]
MNRQLPISLAVAFSTSLVLAACGGGGGSSTASNGTNTSPASTQLLGTVQGLGSVVVNGVRMSTLGSTVTDEDGHTFPQSKLGLGQVVLVAGDTNADGLTGTATQINLIREFSGPVQSVGANTFSLLGQDFSVDTTTVFKTESSSILGTLAQILAGDYVEVYAVRQADGLYVASLVEEQTGKASLESGIEGRGLVSNLDTTAKTFNIGDLTVNYANVMVQGTLANGVAVRFKATQDPVYAMNGTATIVANSVQVKGIQNKLNTRTDQVEVTGFVESDAGDQNPATFTLAGLTIDVSAARYEGLTTLAVGNRVEVKGVLSSGVLMATKVETEEARESSRGGRYEFYGLAGNGAYSSGVNKLTFTIQGQAVEFSRAINQGTTNVCGISTTGSTPYVEVKGVLNNGVIVASKVECKSASMNDDDENDGDDNDRDFSGNRFEMEGVVSNYNSAAREFTLNGTRVSVQSTRFKDGNLSQLSNGDRVEVKGALDANQVFQVSELEFED